MFPFCVDIVVLLLLNAEKANIAKLIFFLHIHHLMYYIFTRVAFLIPYALIWRKIYAATPAVQDGAENSKKALSTYIFLLNAIHIWFYLRMSYRPYSM